MVSAHEYDDEGDFLVLKSYDKGGQFHRICPDCRLDEASRAMMRGGRSAVIRFPICSTACPKVGIARKNLFRGCTFDAFFARSCPAACVTESGTR
jgi:hypothetical protein